MNVRQALESLTWKMAHSAPTHLHYIRGTDERVLRWFEPFADAILSRVHEFDAKKVVLLAPCSYAKPYSASFLHHGIRSCLHEADLLKDVSIWHLSSAGVIPSELEEEYPFCAYDWDNAHASEEDLVALREALGSYFLRWYMAYMQPFPDRTLVTYFRKDSNTQQAIERAARHCGPVMEQIVSGASIIADCVWSSEEEWSSVTFDGQCSDPDCVLLDSNSLKDLRFAIGSVVRGKSKEA